MLHLTVLYIMFYEDFGACCAWTCFQATCYLFLLAQPYQPTPTYVQPKATTSIYCIARANAIAGREAQQMATVGIPGAANNAATGTWAALAAGAAVSVAGPATSRICPTAAAKKVLKINNWSANRVEWAIFAVHVMQHVSFTPCTVQWRKAPGSENAATLFQLLV